MTHFALQAIKEANYTPTWGQMHTRLATFIDGAGYPQHPQIEGGSANKKR